MRLATNREILTAPFRAWFKERAPVCHAKNFRLALTHFLAGHTVLIRNSKAKKT